MTCQAALTRCRNFFLVGSYGPTLAKFVTQCVTISKNLSEICNLMRAITKMAHRFAISKMISKFESEQKSCSSRVGLHSIHDGPSRKGFQCVTSSPRVCAIAAHNGQLPSATRCNLLHGSLRTHKIGVCEVIE